MMKMVIKDCCHNSGNCINCINEKIVYCSFRLATIICYGIKLVRSEGVLNENNDQFKLVHDFDAFK